MIFSEKFESKKSLVKSNKDKNPFKDSTIAVHYDQDLLNRVKFLEEKVRLLEEQSHLHKEESLNNEKSVATVIQKIAEQESEAKKSGKKNKWLDKLQEERDKHKATKKIKKSSNKKR